MSFLLKNDLYTAIKKDELEVLLEESPNLDNDLPEVIDAAVEEIQSYLRHRYDVPAIFFDVWLWNPSEERAVDDHVLLFAEDYDEATSYGVNELAKDPDDLRVYRSLSPNNQGNPLTGGSWFYVGVCFRWYKSLIADNDDDPIELLSWEQSEDPRPKLIKRHAVDLTLYELHTRIKPRQIPEHRVAKHDDAIKYLGDAANPRKNVYLDLPLVDHGEKRGNDASFGSNEKTNHSY